MAVSVEDLITAVKNAADDIKSDALDYVEELEDFATKRFTDFGFSSTDAFVPSPVPDSPNLDELPELKTSNINYDLSGFDPNLYKTATYVSPFFEFLEPHLYDFIDNGGLAASQEIQDAMFDQMRERDNRALNDALINIDKIQGRTAFPIPTHMLLGARNELIGKHQDLQNDRSKEITVIIADRTQDTVKMAIDSGINMEQIQSNFSLGFAKLYMDMSLATITAFKAETEAFITEFEGNLKAMLATVDVNLKNAELDLAYQNQLMKKWEIDLSTSIEKTKVLISNEAQENQLRLAALQGAVSFYASAVVGTTNQVSAIASTSTSTETQG